MSIERSIQRPVQRDQQKTIQELPGDSGPDNVLLFADDSYVTFADNSTAEYT